MKRENYNIKITAGDVSYTHVTHAWNTALRYSIDFVRLLARLDKCDYTLVDKGPRVDCGQHISGSWLWQGDNGKQIIVTIIKELVK